MKHIPKWLDEALSTPKKEDQAINPDNGKPEAPMPDIYADATEVTDPNIKIVAPDTPAGDKQTGFDPYDTVRMHKK